MTLTFDPDLLSQVLQIVFVSTPSLIYMGHAMHTVRREEKRRSREEEGGEGGGREEDQGGGEEGGGGGERGEKHGGRGERDGGKDKRDGPSAGRVRLRGALLQTYILSILIRTIMEVLVSYFVAYMTYCMITVFQNKSGRK